jgi:hypothetical protein
MNASEVVGACFSASQPERSEESATPFASGVSLPALRL